MLDEMGYLSGQVFSFMLCAGEEPGRAQNLNFWAWPGPKLHSWAGLSLKVVSLRVLSPAYCMTVIVLRHVIVPL